MRPEAAASNAFQPRSRKTSVAEQAAPSTIPYNATPISFSIRRASDHNSLTSSSALEHHAQIGPSEEATTALITAQESPSAATKEQVTPEVTRRRSTIKASGQSPARTSPSRAEPSPSPPPDSDALTPSLVPSQHSSAPGSPKSISTRSLRKSDDDSVLDETGSQAVASSGEDEPGPEPELSTTLQDSAPQLIMPRIKMPSRRPFTQRGKGIGRFKVLVAGCQGTGKTSLIKSVVQLCEDIVHVDPLASSTPSLLPPQSSQSKSKTGRQHEPPTEVYASTKPYPTWWSELDESKVLRRRKSMGDAVLERNLCFVNVSTSTGAAEVIRYLQQQLLNDLSSSNGISAECVSLLSGRGGTHVDLVLYLISSDTFQADCDRIKQISEVANVVPLISKSDELSAEQIADMKNRNNVLPPAALPKLPMFVAQESGEKSSSTTSPYTISSATGPDMETMDASLLMSPEYVQPLMPSELALLVQQMFEHDVIAYLRHTAAKKVLAWHALHPQLLLSPSASMSPERQSTLGSPVTNSLSNSGVVLPIGSDLSLTTSNSYALAKLADHTQREERLAQVRLSKWASDLQISLQRERERYEKLARGHRAVWLVERMGEEVREGQVLPVDNTGALVKSGLQEDGIYYRPTAYATHDPLGLLRWNEKMKTRGWIAVQVVSSFGVIGGLALWLAKHWGFMNSLYEWTGGMGCDWFRHDG